jgi:hypothetical protein
MKTLLPVITLLILAGSACQEAPPSPLLGAWEPAQYMLEDGVQHPVAGLIFFAEHDWSVLFFVTNENDTPLRGSGEGGTYNLHGDSLIFSHRYHLSGGHAVGSLTESPLRMEVRSAAQASREPCTIDVRNDSLTIHFPSGNTMLFLRRPGATSRTE